MPKSWGRYCKCSKYQQEKKLLNLTRALILKMWYTVSKWTLLQIYTLKYSYVESIVSHTRTCPDANICATAYSARHHGYLLPSHQLRPAGRNCDGMDFSVRAGTDENHGTLPLCKPMICLSWGVLTTLLYWLDSRTDWRTVRKFYAILGRTRSWPICRDYIHSWLAGLTKTMSILWTKVNLTHMWTV